MERRLTSRNVSLDWVEQDEQERDTISAHLIQNTYTRLKLQYAENLRQNWVEQLESPNQILEQLSLAACLIELWKNMYNTSTEQQSSKPTPFPGFVDIACGNGILVYILLTEGYKGVGYDACRRKTWATFPAEIQKCLEERIFIPKPFADVLDLHGIEIHTGDFPDNTFIISDHADELTVWTPIMAALASPSSPLPFFVIPCCSRSLAGSAYRYPPPGSADARKEVEQNSQPAAGDLRALRARKMEEKTESGFLGSMVGSLAAKTMSIAEDIGFDVEKTWLRTPGAVNMALIGGRRTAQEWIKHSGSGDSRITQDQGDSVLKKITEVVERECSKDGGIPVAAKLWVERTKSLRQGQGMHQAN
ncbi:tRNA (uracil-O(2)-)-methyltransferase [Penicillium cf. griseofulvum]|uniref:tRNA (uracil-O(2)-)-methyltransferase n=1 Tax=Penicillium cf. griseofulvum TaxID=2972120 RepID=A0A9W9MA44_9EURO|nr:tRNA (uracil-O(2)-)-methyltransferase [Penicillium cf. griseofulvum]KAJ5445709.1 tRNA (uracil-O(2)-)-methyltransferase [Penicillium cf. griseofulvum]KAJ5447431.1 tRNA (uracil-O(2)-)-methyltransferase [Penicillium cf. griseofulvum]